MENHTSEAAVKGGQEAEVSLPSSTPRDFMGEIVEGDDDEFGLQWLSMLVEDCHSATFHHHHPPPPTTLKPPPPPPPPPPQEPPNSVNNPTAPLEAKNRKRKLNPLAHHQSSFNYILTPPSDPPLLQQTHWLAESELIFPLKREDEEQKSPPSPLLLKPEEEEEEEELDEDEEIIFHPKRENDDEREEEQQQQQQQQRRCSHCLSLKTPQWRAGPLGPKTLCNACGVRFKSGRLLPEYRPAKSPTFLEDKHSNSHKKIMEMRQLSTKK